jgi:hypothetical protein
MQGDSWDEPTLLPTQGAALDVRSLNPAFSPSTHTSVHSCCRRRRTRTRQPPASPPSLCTSAPTRRASHLTRPNPRATPHSCASQVRAAVTVVLWTPEGRRLLTGSQIGEFTLWNGARPCRPLRRLISLRHNLRHVVQLRDHSAGARYRHPRARVEPQRKLAHLRCVSSPVPLTGGSHTPAYDQATTAAWSSTGSRT